MSPRGSKTGTQGLKGNYERSKIPEALCLEIIKATEIKRLNYANTKTIRKEKRFYKKMRINYNTG